MNCHKLAYHSKAEAREAGKRIVKMGRAEQNRPYLCPYCKRWHLTSMSKREFEEARA